MSALCFVLLSEEDDVAPTLGPPPDAVGEYELGSLFILHESVLGNCVVNLLTKFGDDL